MKSCKPTGKRCPKLLVFVAFACVVVSPIGAATIMRGNRNFNLNRKQAWSGNIQPGVNDIAAWASGSATTSSLGGNLSWLGIQILDPSSTITINAGGILTLGGAGIDMTAATVNFNLNCAVVLGVAQVWSVNGGRTLAASGIISGTGGITKTGAGTLILSGSNTFTGSTTINGGTLSGGSAAALGSGSGALTINPTGIFQATATFSTSRAVVLGGIGGAASGGTFDVTGIFNETRTGVISGAGSLTKTGSGTLTLTGTNTYTGDTYINGGTVSVGNAQSLGPQPSLGSALYATHMANGTTLQITTSSSLDNRQIELVSGTATVDLTSGLSHQRNGLIYGGGGLIKTGSGTEILTNANTYTGGTTINGGILQVNNSAASGTGTGAVTVNSGGTLSGLPTATGFATPGTISGTVTVNSGGALLARSGGTFTFGGLSLNASAVSAFQIGAATNTAIINITGINGLSLAGASTVTIMNAGGLAAGTYHLFDYSGTALASIANLTLGSTPGGGFTYSLVNNTANTSIDLLVLASTAQWGNAAGGNWSVAGNWANGAAPSGIGAQANFLGAISSPQTVTVDAAYTVGTILFNNSNAYTIAGTNLLTLSNSGTAGISVQAGSHIISAPLALTDNLDITATTATALTISGAITENTAGRTLISDGAGTVTLSGTSANTYTGLTMVTAGTLNFNKTAGVNAIGTGGIQIDSGATGTLLASNQIADTASAAVNGTLNLGTNSETIGALNGTGSVVTGAGSTLTVGAANNLTSQFDGVISGAGTIAKVGTGQLTLTGANTFGGAGQTIALNGGTLQISADNNLGNTANSLTFNAATLGLSSALTTARAVLLNSSGGTIDTGNNADTFSGIISGTGALTKSGTGTLTLSGSNTYTGGSTINNGTIVVNSASNLGAGSGALAINGGTLHVATGFSTSRNIALGSATSAIQVDAAQTYTASGVLSGAGTLNKTGPGALTLTGANTFTGDTVIDGTLTAAASSGSALATTASITVNNGGTLLLGASNQINNSAGITLDGGTLGKGNFSEGTAGSVGVGALTLSATGSHLDFGAGTVGVLSFASFDPSVDLLSITIGNWTGTANTLGTASTDRLIFNTTQSGNLAYFNFAGYVDGATQFSLGNGFYEVTPVTPVPEPATYAAGVLALAAIACHLRRKFLVRDEEQG